jgi:hypothetical protein
MLSFELGYNIMKGTEYFVLWTSFVLAEEYNVTINSDELIGTPDCVTL